MKQHTNKEFHRMQQLAGLITEIKINDPAELLPISKIKDGNYVLDYYNLIRNMRNFQNLIQKYLNITDKDELYSFLTIM